MMKRHRIIIEERLRGGHPSTSGFAKVWDTFVGIDGSLYVWRYIYVAGRKVDRLLE